MNGKRNRVRVKPPNVRNGSKAKTLPFFDATAFLEAFRNMDEPQFDRFFSPDVTMFFPESPLGKQRVEGKANVLAAFHHFFASVRKQGSSKLDISPLDQ